MRFLLLPFLMLTSCGSDNRNKPATHMNDLSELQGKRDLYVELLKDQQGEAGFVSKDCDALLWSSLASVGGVSLDLTAAQDADGRWYRRPDRSCYGNGESASSISRDMLIGVFWWGWRSRNVAAIDKTYAYGSENDWVMGEGDISRTFLTPSGQATLSEVLFRIGGKDHEFHRGLPQLWNSGLEGFEAHLQILHILIRGELLSGISNDMLERLSEHYSRNPENALYAYAHARYTGGSQTEAIALLHREEWFPRTRLPTSADRCEDWLFQRESGTDWQPCPEQGLTHHGGDFIFLTKLIEESYEG